MANLSNDQIERISTNKVENSLNASKLLVANVNKQDKGISFDGSITCCTNSTVKKIDNLGNFKIQVKGREVKKITDLEKESRSFSVSKSDLKNYLSDGGVMFFVVDIFDNENTKTYYNALAPIDLQDILSKLKNSQKSKAITLKPFSLDTVQIEVLCHTFLADCKKQKSTAKTGYVDPTNTDEYKNIHLNLTLDKNGYPILQDQEIYLYKPLEDDILKPLNKIPVKNCCFKIPIEFSISSNKNEDFFTTKATVEKYLDPRKSDVLNIGKAITINTDKNNPTLKYDNLGNIKERLEDLTILKSIFVNQAFKLNNKISVEFPTIDKDIKQQIDTEYIFYDTLDKTLEKLGIKDEIILDGLQEKDFQLIDEFLAIVNGDMTISNEDIENPTPHITFKLSNLTIYFLGIRQNDSKKVQLLDIFSEQAKLLLAIYGGEKVSIYSKLHSTLFIDISNINYEMIYENIVSIPYGKTHEEHTTNLLLQMLIAFDECKKKKLLDCATNISQWQVQQNKNHHSTLNYMQCIKRERSLNEKEKKELYDIKKDCFNIEEKRAVLLAVNILLENSYEFEYEFNKLSNKEQESFKKFPIFNLLKIT